MPNSWRANNFSIQLWLITQTYSSVMIKIIYFIQHFSIQHISSVDKKHLLRRVLDFIKDKAKIEAWRTSQHYADLTYFSKDPRLSPPTDFLVSTLSSSPTFLIHEIPPPYTETTPSFQGHVVKKTSKTFSVGNKQLWILLHPYLWLRVILWSYLILRFFCKSNTILCKKWGQKNV